MDKPRTQQRGRRRGRRRLSALRFELLLTIVVSLMSFTGLAEQPGAHAGRADQPRPRARPPRAMLARAFLLRKRKERRRAPNRDRHFPRLPPHRRKLNPLRL